jgi:hypothetical protein
MRLNSIERDLIIALSILICHVNLTLNVTQK